MSSEFASNEQIVQAARNNLHQAAWDYLVGGTESETTMRRNRLGFDRLGFRPRILVDVSSVDTSITFLGQRMRIPVMLAPIGSTQLLHRDGAIASAAAAGEFGTVHVVSSVTEPGLEDTAAAGGGPKFFQLYVRGDMDWVRELLGRVKAAGYSALCLTVDVPVLSRRERPMLNRWSIQRVPGGGRPVPGAGGIGFQSRQTWETMDQIKEIGGLPFMLKGVATAEDARVAVEHGVDVIWVSNHGGRQLDSQLGTMDTLPEIVEAVAGRAKIVLDGGIQRGGDVLKALALGADVVAIGKLQGWGLGAAGKDGVLRVLEILEHEMYTAMAMLGVTSVDQLTPKHICPAEPVIQPHEMSMWVNMPGGRVL